MLIGDTYYYRLVGGRLTSAADFDSDTPCHVSDARCLPNEVALWIARNGGPETVVAAGAKIRAKYPTDAAICAAVKAAIADSLMPARRRR